MTTAPAGRRNRARTVSRALGNVLLGVAIGLVVYYAVTDADAGLAQRTTRRELRRLGPVAAPAPSVVTTSAQGPVFDFSGWAEQDARFWRESPTGAVVGRIVIRRMGLDMPIVKGTDRETLKHGPGWIVTTNVPGPTGNCAVSGHRTTYLAPFRHLDRLHEGDVIDVYTPFRRYRYTVLRSFAVRPWQVEVIAPTKAPTLTLTACHPPYSARYRLIVQSRLTDARPIEGAPTSAP